MAVPPTILADNAAQLRRLQLVVGRLNADRDLGDGWTEGVALAHLAFWDRRAVRVLNHWQQHGTPPDDHPNDDILNDVLLDEWRVLTVRQAAGLAVEAAKAVSAAVEKVDGKTAKAITAAGDDWLLRRGRHRREHLDQIERAAPTRSDDPAPRPNLRGERVLLRLPRLNDKEDGLKAGRDPELVRMYGGDYRNVSPLTPEEVGRWYERLQSDPLAWVIEADGQCIGHCRLHSLDKDNRSARFAIGIFNRAFWGKGYGTEATRLVLKHAFEELKLHRVDLRVLHYNERAIAAFKKCGFDEEGRERDSALVAGEWHTDIRMSILEDEYRALGEG